MFVLVQGLVARWWRAPVLLNMLGSSAVAYLYPKLCDAVATPSLFPEELRVHCACPQTPLLL